MTFVGLFSTALSGLDAQSRALGAISDNIANASTNGYRRVETNFQALVTEASQSSYQPGGVVASPLYVNAAPGQISSTDFSTNMAVLGKGFLTVGKPDGAGGFDEANYYTRAGDFLVDGDGYLSNSAGYVARGYATDPVTGLPGGSLTEMQITDRILAPAPSTAITYRANLPADAAPGAQAPASVDVFDAQGVAHAVNLAWTKDAANSWTLGLTVPDDAAFTPVSQAVTFDGNGRLLTPAAPITFSPSFAGVAQPLTLDLGAVGASDALTQYQGTQVETVNVETDGYPRGALSGVSVDQNGGVVLAYDNGERRTAYTVALAGFNAPERLQSVAGQAFQETDRSGTALIGRPDQFGLGSLVGSSVESSNVDIGDEFTKLITTQRAYSANTKVLTTVDEMLQEILSVKR